MFPYYIMSDASLIEPLNDDAVLTKPKQKKPRSDAQQEATKKMLLARDEKMKTTTQKAFRKAVVEHLNSSAPLKVVSESEESEASEPEPQPVKKKVKAVAVTEAPPVPPPVPPPKKKEPKVIYQSESESEEEVVIVKKRKKPKKKTIIYEESESEEEAVSEAPPPKPKPRETKTQQNARTGFKVTVPEVKPKQPVYYFAE